MINQINSSSGLLYQPDSSQKAASKKTEKKDGAYDAAFSIDISIDSRTKGSKALSSDEIESIKNQADMNSAPLRDVVEKLILRQQNNTSAFKVNIEILGATGDVQTETLPEDSEWGVEAVSDRIVSFAKALSNGDPAKIELLREAIDKGFASAKKTLGGELPEISNQTYDAVMSKLDDWANEGKPEATE